MLLDQQYPNSKAKREKLRTPRLHINGLDIEEFLLLNLLLFLLGRLTLRSQGGPQLRLDSISTKSLLVTHRQHVHTGTSAPSDPTQAVAYHAHGDAVIVDLDMRTFEALAPPKPPASDSADRGS